MLKKSFIKLLRWILKKIAQLTIWKFRPGIVGVTGSVGKTSAKLAITTVLSSERTVRCSKGNLNNDFGLPLTIIGDWSPEQLKLVSHDTPIGEKMVEKIAFWAKVVFGGIWRIIAARRDSYPEILVLEYGADRPGDLRYLLEIARPNISVITAIGDIPVHVEYYSGADEVAREKARLIEYLPSAGFAVLNFDDATVMGLKDRTRAHVMTFGYGEKALVRVTGFENRIIDSVPGGVAFKLEYGGSFVPVRLDNVFGKVQSYAAASAACIGLIFGLNLVKISEALKSYQPASGRMKLLPGVKSSLILDDSYNASPLSMHAALETLKGLPAKRRIAVLGDMLEIGRYSMEAHERMGRIAAKAASILVTIGPRAKFIAEGAKEAGLNRRNIFSFETAEDACETVGQLLKKGDLVLLKGSHSMNLEKVVAEVRQIENQ